MELVRAGILFERQKAFRVLYKGEFIGEYVADVMADGKVLLEFKAVRRLTELHEASVCAFHIHVGADLVPSWYTDLELPADFGAAGRVPPELFGGEAGMEADGVRRVMDEKFLPRRRLPSL